MGFWDNIACGGNIAKAAQLAAQNANLGKQLSVANALAASQAQEISNLNIALAATGSQAQEQVADLTGKLTDAQNAIIACNQQLAQTASVFTKPAPAILLQVEPQKVMLGQFTNRTAAPGYTWASYPNHPSIYFITPWYEGVLTQADCNRQRTDLTSIEICMKIANVCQKNATYLDDQSQWGVPDDWHPGFFVLINGKDDCETLSQNILSAIKYYEVKWGAFPDCDAVQGLGHLIEGSSSFGHGFVLVLSNASTALKDSYVIEATLTFEANAVNLQEGQANYQADWGIIAFGTKANPDGTYDFQPASSWWGTSFKAHPGCHCARCQQALGQAAWEEGILSKLRRFITRELSEEEQYRALIARIWEPRRRIK